ncbi:hypothetical protein OSTOST_08362 [Ostertagia ostertagi]
MKPLVLRESSDAVNHANAQQSYTSSPTVVRQDRVTPEPQPVYSEPNSAHQHNETRKDDVEEYVPPTSKQPKPHIALARREERALVAELRETVGKSGGDVLRKKETRPTATKSTIQITADTSPEDVALWLQEKGFSLRVIELLEGQDGANLFALNKASLMQACGKEEGSRLYSQLLVQKNQSNYQTHTSAELQAILNYRKQHVDVTNEAAKDDKETVAL